MKNLVLILALILTAFSVDAQWKHYAGGNDFDGKYLVSTVVGKSTDRLYHAPKVVVNKILDDNQVNFYFKGFGNTVCKGDKLTIIFNNSKKRFIFEEKDLRTDRSSRLLFLDIKSKKTLEVLSLMKSASTMKVRFINDCNSAADMAFSMRGSSAAISKIINVEKKLEEKRLAKYNSYVYKNYAKTTTEKGLPVTIIFAKPRLNTPLRISAYNFGQRNATSASITIDSSSNSFDFTSSMIEKDHMAFIKSGEHGINFSVNEENINELYDFVSGVDTFTMTIDGIRLSVKNELVTLIDKWRKGEGKVVTKTKEIVQEATKPAEAIAEATIEEESVTLQFVASRPGKTFSKVANIGEITTQKVPNKNLLRYRVTVPVSNKDVAIISLKRLGFTGAFPVK